ncbi:MAG TPA: nucleotidyltransferase domain-containing protein [Thermodesulfovibrionales bacterium]|jgi:predicted nucleotidyltransferase|nr:nucleotidyltransferase domain-containing protein [Thermodesulfovibrionales bacterium]
MATLSLAENEKEGLDELIAFLRSSWPLSRFIVFGSKAKGTADEESDIDLLIKLPCAVSEDIRRTIILKVFDINLRYESNLSVFIVSEDEWQRGVISVLPIHDFIEEEGIPL